MLTKKQRCFIWKGVGRGRDLLYFGYIRFWTLSRDECRGMTVSSPTGYASITGMPRQTIEKDEFGNKKPNSLKKNALAYKKYQV